MYSSPNNFRKLKSRHIARKDQHRNAYRVLLGGGKRQRQRKRERERERKNYKKYALV